VERLAATHQQWQLQLLIHLLEKSYLPELTALFFKRRVSSLLHPHTRAEDLRTRLQQLYVPVYGTTATLLGTLAV
jgi:hypothetical protein